MNTATLHTTAQRWLTSGKKDSVKQLINQYLLLTGKYGGSSKLDVDKWVDDMFADNHFPVKRLIQDNPGYNRPNERYIEFSNPQNAIETIQRMRSRDVFNGDDMAFLFFSLAISVALFSFRVTKTRTWFIALIGACIWGMIFGLLGFIIRAEAGVMGVFIALSLGMLIFTATSIARATDKAAAGVSFVWFQWSMAAIMPLGFLIIERLLRIKDDGYYVNGIYHSRDIKQPWIVDWIASNGNTIAYADIALVILAILVVIVPLARKWQAMPEE